MSALIATRWPVCVSIASYTEPMPPLPSGSADFVGSKVGQLHGGGK